MDREIINPTNEQLCDLMCGKPEDDREWELKVETKVSITGQDIDDIISTAFEGGINYWCDEAKVDGEYLGEYASDQISRGGGIYLHDMEEESVYYLDINSFLYGLKLYLQENPELIENGTIDTCNVDADVADQIIQYAVFKEVIYG